MANYEVIARKWRPQQFADVVGQEHVTRTLKNAIESKRLAHAYLFVGPRGIGKTSVARILAKALNCVKGPTITPCDQCDSCKEVTLGNSLDVLEIDGASNNGVEQVRDLRDTVKYAPTRGPFKIYIIDEVHMLSNAAFNALLKTLEEPPPHVKFIFATTEPQKILATIVSRCQRFDLRRIAVPAIIERLRLIADSDKVKISDDALLAIARGAEGGLRDAESALDQLISFKGNQIEEADVLSVFGLVSRKLLEETAQQVLTGDIKGLIETVAGIDEAGKDMQRFAVELMEHFRNLLICTHVDNPARAMELTDAQVETLKKQAALASMENLLRIIGIFTDTEERMRFALSRRTLMETALIRCARTATVASLETILAEINKLKAGGGWEASAASGAEKKSSPVPGPALAMASAPTPQGARSGDSSADASGGGSEPDFQGRSNAGARMGSPRAAVAPSAGADDLKRLRENWVQVLEKAGKTSIKAKRLLIDALPMAVDGDKVVIGLDAEFSDEIQEIKNGIREREALEAGLHSVLLRKVTFELREVDMASIPREPLDGKHGRQAAPDSPAPAAADAARKPGAKTRKDLIEDPMVQKTLEAFNGSITEVRS